MHTNHLALWVYVALDPYPDVLVQCLLVFDLVKYSEGQCTDLRSRVASHKISYNQPLFFV